MKRFVSVWLPAFPMQRLVRASPTALPVGVPLALVEDQGGRRLVTALNAIAHGAGVARGMALPDARAICPGLAVREAERRADRLALRRLARWCGRYGPNRNVSTWGAPADGDDHGLWIEITGVAHLFGGEAALLGDLCSRLARAGFTARAAIADTYGGAHALARTATTAGGRFVIAPPGETAAALAALPVSGLRLTPETLRLLVRLGLKRIGDLYGRPRAALERRFRETAPRTRGSARTREAPALAAAVVARLDAALGLTAEPLRPLSVAPQCSAQRPFPEPLISSAGLEAAASEVTSELCAVLAASGLAARRVRLLLYRADGSLAAIETGTCRPCRTPEHLMRLMTERLAHVDAGFGIDLVAAEALRVVPLAPEQTGLADDHPEEGLGRLIDVLTMRLGRSRVQAIKPYASHVPERAQRLAWASSGAVADGAPWPPYAGPPRPPLIFPDPEPIAVMAEIPEGPPRHFTWRRLLHRVRRAEGPERIAPEWWRHLRPPQEKEETENTAADDAERARDYYRVEVEGGARFWIFREGFYESSGAPPAWFVHGLFG